MRKKIENLIREAELRGESQGIEMERKFRNEQRLEDLEKDVIMLKGAVNDLMDELKDLTVKLSQHFN